MIRFQLLRKLWNRRFLITVAGGVVCFVLFAPVAISLIPFKGPLPPVAHPDPLVRHHEVLKRTNEAYALRIESIRQLRVRAFAAGSPRSVEDEILTAAQELVRIHGLKHASAMALRRVTLMAPRVSAACGKAGIALGPNVVPELLEIRLRTAEECKRLGELIAEYQFAELVRALCTAAAEKESGEPTAAPPIPSAESVLP